MKWFCFGFALSFMAGAVLLSCAKPIMYYDSQREVCNDAVYHCVDIWEIK
jgi:hypothetical protein